MNLKLLAIILSRILNAILDITFLKLSLSSNALSQHRFG